MHSLILILVLMGIPAVGLFVLALWRAPWRSWLEGHRDRQNVWGLSLLLTALITWMRIDAAPGLSLQLLIVPSMTLMHGWALALIANGIAIAIACLFHGHAEWTNWPNYFLFDVALPAGFITLLHRVLTQRLPRHFVVYFFGTVFAGSILSFLLSGAARLALLAALDALPGGMVLRDYAVLLVMLGFAQGTINGMVMSTAVMFRPEWVRSFDPKVYFRR
ncbi:MAG: hypothetical protein U1F35_20890 [Steroidobacteraceae bacterium]